LSSNPNLPPISGQPPLDPKFFRRKLQQLAWIRAGLGAITGVLTGVLGFIGGSTQHWNAYFGLYVPVLVYIGTYYLAKYPMGLGLMQKDRGKLISQGIGGFFLIFLFVWVLYNSLCASNACFHF
jgi:hypothetical protein